MANGILIIDKPQDWTSMDVCARLRRCLGERRIGHAGTLDPMATGVLPVFVGRATRAVEFASEGQKEYLAGLRLGLVTDTQDTSGAVLEERPAAVTPGELEAVLPRFRGPIQQVPPMYSAIKIQGKKLYERARKGREVERPPRPITIHSLTVEDVLGPDRFLIRVRCSKGTYVRTLCHDIGQALGCGAPWPPAFPWSRPSLWSGSCPTRSPTPCCCRWTPIFRTVLPSPFPLPWRKRCVTGWPSPSPAQRRESTGSMERTGAFWPSARSGRAF